MTTITRRFFLFPLEPRCQRNSQLLGIRPAARRVREDFAVAQQQVRRARRSVGRQWRRSPRLLQARVLPENHHAADVVPSVQQFTGRNFSFVRTFYRYYSNFRLAFLGGSLGRGVGTRARI